MIMPRLMVSLSLAAALVLAAAGPLRAQEPEAPVPPDRTELGIDSLLAELRTIDEALAREPADRSLAFRRLDALYRAGVHEKWAAEAGLASLDSLPTETPSDSALSFAYRGAFRTLMGKHAFWPHSKINHVRRGMSLLDRAVGIAPESARIRYLRLMSGYYLPGLFQRGDEVRADFMALSRLLPHARWEFPPRLYAEVCRFVLENGDLSGAERALLHDLVVPLPQDDGARESIGGEA